MLPASAARLLPFLPPLLRALRVPPARPLDAAAVPSPPAPAPASPRAAPIEGAGLPMLTQPLLSLVDEEVDFPYDFLNRLLARLDSGYATSFVPPLDILSPAVSCVCACVSELVCRCSSLSG